MSLCAHAFQEYSRQQTWIRWQLGMEWWVCCHCQRQLCNVSHNTNIQLYRTMGTMVGDYGFYCLLYVTGFLNWCWNTSCLCIYMKIMFISNAFMFVKKIQPTPQNCAKILINTIELNELKKVYIEWSISFRYTVQILTRYPGQIRTKP